MSFIQNMMFGGGPPNPRQDLINSSMRGGLPQVLDMLRAYPSYFFERKDLENGNKILLPIKVLQEITERYHGNLPNPMIFSLSTLRNKNTIFCGVLEFEAPENTVVLPFWLFSQMKLSEGEMLRLGLVTYLEKGNYIKIRPHKTEFIDLPDPKAILEHHLRNFVCVTLNETISISILGKEYLLDILELKPKTQYNAVVLVDTDISLEFAPPLDYVEPVRKQPATPAPPGQGQGQGQATAPLKPGTPFGGPAVRMDGKALKPEQTVVAEKEMDLRKFKIAKGIRKEWHTNFSGGANKIGGAR